MAIQTDPHRPFTLWFETLPTSDTARLLIWPRANEVKVVLYWNREFHSERTFGSLDAAEAWGHQLHDVIQHDALAGLLLGYDQEVLTRLQAQASSV